MNDTTTTIIAVLAFAAMAYVFRAFWANNRTLNDRMEIIRALEKAGWPRDGARAFERFKYEDHFRAVFWGRDPLRLYSPRLVAIIKAYRSVEASA